MENDFERLCDALDSATHGLLPPASCRQGVAALLREGERQIRTGDQMCAEWFDTVLEQADAADAEADKLAQQEGL